ncbi:hypothetical protein MD535_10050 [Vibrio sp. ZSDZ65]|uniref:Uncharacterized protein n=1 Tax=Vibrio qingdaonensis TaxID=2829491 RepID=A0A9X3HX12_9VIBR|nr:hypothetical protein [Vibrio qingdaonensis]MCW8346342.1 hypothetical protein [Vibrio qingdaonensis]
MSKDIYLNDRKYHIHDIGEGENVVFIFHRGEGILKLEDIVSNILKKHQRIIVIDLTEDFPTDVSSLSSQRCKELIDDIHLLADVYWLDDISLESNYINKPIQREIVIALGPRYAPQKNDIISEKQS